MMQFQGQFYRMLLWRIWQPKMNGGKGDIYTTAGRRRADPEALLPPAGLEGNRAWAHAQLLLGSLPTAPAYFRSRLTDLSVNPPSEFFLNPTADVPGRNAGTHILNSSGILYVEITLVLSLNYLTDQFKQYIHESKAEFGERIGDNIEVII